jgi:hypothetical protein
MSNFRYPGDPLASSASILQHNTKIEAELSCIDYGLSRIIQSWMSLDQYLSQLQVEDFMHPNQYVNLLFDDQNSKRSRKYFWAIGCLNEFELTISDNIKQLDLYFAARIKPLLDDKNPADWLDAVSLRKDPKLSSLESGITKLAAFKELARKVKNQRESLVNLQNQFRNKLETDKSLRDGVGIPFHSISHYFYFTAKRLSC